MSLDLNSKLIAFLLVVTVTVICGHRLGLMDTQLDAVELTRSHFGTGAAEKQLKGYGVTCDIFDNTKSNHCGIGFTFSYDKTKGIDLSRYNRVDIEVKFVKPDLHEKLRFYIRNFDPNYSKKGDSGSLKYNTIEYSPGDGFETLSIPFDYFQVATWWLSKKSIPFNDSQFDVRNVPIVEFSSGRVAGPGLYEIVVNDITFRGELVSELTLLKALFLLWLTTAILILNNQRISMEKSTREDALTGILNRRGLEQWLAREFKPVTNNLVMYYIDIDDFKRINDTYGHLIGDKLIRGFCQNLQIVLHRIKTDSPHAFKSCFTRISGDEFAILIKSINLDRTEQIAIEILQQISEPIEIDSRDIRINASIGIATNDIHARTSEVLIDNADAAMYYSKKLGKNQYRIFDNSLSGEMQFNKKISGGLRRALDEELFHLVFMPIYAFNARDIVAAEVLIRCKADELDGVDQNTYIPIAEEYGLIKEIDLWVMEFAFEKIATIPEAKRITYNINISALELNNKSFLSHLKFLLKKYKISTRHLLFEITETSLVDADNQSVLLLQQLSNMGIRLALDDFGTGYTAFSQLLDYPINCLKIDKSFIEKIDSGNQETTMIEAIMTIAKSYRLEVVGEGVETETQLKYLKSLNCDYFQGYYLAKPVTWEELLETLEEPKTPKQHTLHVIPDI